MTGHTFHAFTSPIRALNPIGFSNTRRSNLFDSVEPQHVSTCAS
ncbi:uncharacterized protein G2W53_040241 [Senna tora]|uniref:Uncharacterized protein n=1 Tax=Senna tora TaxID=362788 RepID=A0A834SSE5_9FABA|nr:uncharacterized protein G2W53_040241 [Senna tora]